MLYITDEITYNNHRAKILAANYTPDGNFYYIEIEGENRGDWYAEKDLEIEYNNTGGRTHENST